MKDEIIKKRIQLKEKLESDQQKWEQETFNYRLSSYEANEGEIHFFLDLLNNQAIDLDRKIDRLNDLRGQIQQATNKLTVACGSFDPLLEGKKQVLNHLLSEHEELSTHVRDVMNQYLIYVTSLVREVEEESR